jgi:hypothetical protein
MRRSLRCGRLNRFRAAIWTGPGCPPQLELHPQGNAVRISPAIIITVCLFPFGVLSAPAAIAANAWFVAPNGTPAGPGTLAQPYDLATALSGTVGGPGDTFWLRGGNYVIGHIDTKIQGAPGQPITFSSRPGEAARVNGSLSFFESGGNVVLQNFELYSSDTNRFSTQTNAGFNPTDLHLISGIASYSPNLSFINLVLHDETGEGIYISHEGTNSLIYGCVIFNNGWRSPDNAEGHGIYVQGFEGTREVADNIVFNNAGVGLHIYANDTNANLTGIIMDGNVAFHAGAIQNERAYRDWIVGVDAPAISADQIVFENNMGYFPLSPSQNDLAQFGREGVNGSIAIQNNYLPAGIELNNWFIAAVSGNTLAAQSANYAVSLNESQTFLWAAWNNNNYALLPTSGGFLNGSAALNFFDWQTATGFDANSTSRPENMSGTQIFVRPNRFVAGRANIIVYNWDNLTNVAVDVSSVLPPGTRYEVRNAADFFAPPVLSGVFNGQPLILPMRGLTVAVPNGPMLTPPPTGPTFNVFVLLPVSIPLQITTPAIGQVLLSWPTNFGTWILQSTASLGSGTWADVTNTTYVVGSENVVTNTTSGTTRFYRLRSAP